jgi:hypothetical protein
VQRGRARAPTGRRGDSAVLTVNFRQPSHEFTFGVGINLISYPMVLTPLYNKFARAYCYWSLLFMQDFSAKRETSG